MRIVFSIATGDSHAYPPCGLRVAAYDTFEVACEDIVTFFAHVDGVEDAQTCANVKQLMREIDRHAAGRLWSLVIDGEYHCTAD